MTLKKMLRITSLNDHSEYFLHSNTYQLKITIVNYILHIIDSIQYFK